MPMKSKPTRHAVLFASLVALSGVAATTVVAQAAPQAPPAAAPGATAAPAPADVPFSAAKSFISFYAFNSGAYKSVCDKEGVDVSSFVNAFTSEHAALYTQATGILKAHGMQMDQVQARLKATLAASEPDVRQALQDNAVHEKAGTTTKDGCRYLAAHGSELAQGLLLTKFHPEIVAAMNGGTP